MCTGCTGGVSDQTFTATNARYVRIKAIKPDGPDQTGGQMGIAELEVYGNPTFTPAALPDQSVVVKPDINIANNKQTKAYYINGTVASMASGHEAKYAVDGNTSTYAQATGQYRWIEEVDLERAYSINKIVTTFANGLYATEYEIQASLTGAAGSFTTIKSVTGCTGGRNEQKLNLPVNARYIRIQANKPDAVGQTGVQMAIAELEIYQDKNAFFKKTATGYYNDGSLATMWTGYEADKANDGDINTYAQATGQYAWTEQIDMGAVYNIDKISISFAEDTFATQYDIQVSINGTSFTTVKSVTGCTGGGDVQSFTPVDARYVRIKAIKPDGPNQTGIQMGLAEVNMTVNDNVLKMSQMTDGAAPGNKYIYQRISSQQITFQTGDVIAYDVKLFTNDAAIGGIEIYNTDSSGFGGTGWTDQNSVGGTPGADLTGRALNKWYHRELTVPASMVGKTSNKWMLSFENDSVGKLLQAAYDNIVVIRGGSIVGTIYKNGNPSENVLQLINSYYSPVNVFMVNR